MPDLSDTTEIPLRGGNVRTGVVRVGDTVRRPAGPHTPAVHALLAHLHDVGFTHAPRAAGVDDQDREILDFAPGTPIHPNRRDLLDGDAAMARIGRISRALHDAAASFTPPPDAQWNVVIPDVGADLVVHHDLAPWNVVVDPATDRWTIIDWDTAAPGTRLWDLAYTATSFVPLTPDGPDPVEQARRFRVLVDAYGLTVDERARLIALLPARSGAMRDLLVDGAATGTQPWADLHAQGHGTIWRSITTPLHALLDDQRL